jgi:hypothetical protein
MWRRFCSSVLVLLILTYPGLTCLSVKIPAHLAPVSHCGYSGDLAIQVYFGARNVTKQSAWRIFWQGDNPGQPGFNRGILP